MSATCHPFRRADSDVTRRTRIGPDQSPAGSIGSPCCRMSTSPATANERTTLRAASIVDRHDAPPTARAASDGQIVEGARCRASARTAASRRSRRPSSLGDSHHGSPRSPSATFADRTRRRATCSSDAASERFADATARRASISSSTSSWRSLAGIEGSLVRQRRPPTTIQRPSAVRSGALSSGG